MNRPHPTLQMSLLTTPNAPAHNPSGADSQPLGSKLTKSVGLADCKELHIIYSLLSFFHYLNSKCRRQKEGEKMSWM